MTPPTSGSMSKAERRTPNGAVPERDSILHALRSAFAGPAWHGPSVLAALRGVDAAEAAWRPAPGRHCVWELALHVAYGHHVARRRIEGPSAGRFPRRLVATWWPALPDELSPAAWAEDLALLRAGHERLTAGAAELSRRALARTVKGRALREHLLGIALHDAYHAGQIRLVRRLGSTTP